MKRILSCFFLAAASVPGLAQGDPAQEAARLMVEQEGKFLQMSLEQGTRAAFLHFLADNAIVFQPGPVNGKQAWSKRPEHAISLSWKPLLAVMARSADLGYTTGPAEWRKSKEDEKPVGYGEFISIWRKQPDGTWKAALDVGGEVPGPAKFEEPPQLVFSFSPDPPATAGARVSPFKKLRETETKFMAASKSDSTAALVASSSPAIRVIREGVFPALGKEAAGLMLSVRRGKLSMERMGGGVSTAGDLAYSYGKYTLVNPQNIERGHYLQIWRADKFGWWQIALDYQAPLPVEEKK